MRNKKIIIIGAILAVAFLFSSCASRNACSTKNKTRVDMGWM